MTLLLQVSDPHFGTEVPEVVQALQRLVEAQRPDVVAWSGDITQRARRAQFDAAQRFAAVIAPPPVRTVAIPGNHDIPLFNLAARLFAPYGNFRRAFGEDLEPELDLDDLLLITVKTTRRCRHKHGVVSPAQIERVARRLRSARRAQLRVVMTHQPLYALAEQDARHQVRGAGEALREWVSAGADVALGGHIHLPYVCRIEQALRHLWVVQAGTAVSSRVRGSIEQSVNLLRCEPVAQFRGRRLRCSVERWDHNPERGAFERVQRLELPLAR